MTENTIPITEKTLQEALSKIKGIEGIQDFLKEFTFGKRYSNLPQDALIAEVVKKINEPYKTYTFDTTVANVNPIEQGFKGGVFQIIDVRNGAGVIDPDSYVDVRFNSPQASPIRFRLGYRIITPFERFWISNPAQNGIIFTIGMGLEFDNIFQFDFPVSPQATLLNSLLIALRSINPDTGTQITVSGNAAAATVVIYTVPANQTLYISSCFCHVSTVSTTGLGYLFITNAADVTQYYLGGSDQVFATGAVNHGYGIPYPVLVPAGYKVKLYSSVNVVTITGGIHGWLE